MNRRNFFKVVTGFVAGVFATSAVAKEKPKLTVAMLQKAKKELDAQKEYPAIWSVWYPDMETSSANVNCMFKISYWDKDEPDIYTFEDGVPIS